MQTVRPYDVDYALRSVGRADNGRVIVVQAGIETSPTLQRRFVVWDNAFAWVEHLLTLGQPIIVWAEQPAERPDKLPPTAAEILAVYQTLVKHKPGVAATHLAIFPELAEAAAVERLVVEHPTQSEWLYENLAASLAE